MYIQYIHVRSLVTGGGRTWLVWFIPLFPGVAYFASQGHHSFFIVRFIIFIERVSKLKSVEIIREREF